MSFPVHLFSSVNAYLEHDTRISDPRLYRNRSRGNKDPYYRITLTTDWLEYNRRVALDAALDYYQGAFEVFTLINPMPVISQRTGLQLNADYDKGTQIITMRGLPFNETNALMAGDFIQISGFTKAYRVAQTASADSGGAANVTLTQPLIDDVPFNAAVNHGANVEFQVCMDYRNSPNIDGINNMNTMVDVELIEQL